MSKPRGVRVIAGAHRGRRLVTPPGDSVRPTKGIVREAVFSALDARGLLVDAQVLDLYAGVGALAIEALSRGATRAVLVERNRVARGAIEQNLEALQLADRTRVVAVDVPRFVAGVPPVDAPFDLVFVDPPYETSDESVTALLDALGAPGWLNEGGVVAVERPGRHPVVLPEGWQTGWQRAFGDTLASFCTCLAVGET